MASHPLESLVSRIFMYGGSNFYCSQAHPFVRIWGVYWAYHCRIIHLKEQFCVSAWTSRHLCARFDIFIVMTVKITVMWYMLLCSLVERYQCFRGILLLWRWRQQVLQMLVHIIGIMEKVINWPFSKVAFSTSTNSFINSFCSLSCDGSIASSTVSSPDNVI
jgi:hypothetical protein